MKNFMSMSFKSLPENVGVARIAVATFAVSLDFTAQEVEEIKVAVSEAVSNSVLHGYPKAQGEITLKAHTDGDVLEILVSDQGAGISDIEKALTAGYSTLEGHMGLGFSFIDSFMDGFWVHSSLGCGTEVRMIKERCIL